jgi:hypothetical protein
MLRSEGWIRLAGPLQDNLQRKRVLEMVQRCGWRVMVSQWTLLFECRRNDHGYFDVPVPLTKMTVFPKLSNQNQVEIKLPGIPNVFGC